MEKSIVILSGGADSTICIAWAKQHLQTEIHAITFNYAQKHERELKCAKKIGELLGVASHEFINVEGVLKGTSPLVNKNENVKQYKTVEDLPEGVEPTFVPSRNLLFLTIASNRAYVLDARHMIIGVCCVDYGGYTDCRKEFINSACATLNLSNYGQPYVTKEKGIILHTPLMFLTKKESILLAKKLGIIPVLKYTHTCYNNNFKPCGHCHSCLLRVRGFSEAQIEDPLLQLTCDW